MKRSASVTRRALTSALMVGAALPAAAAAQTAPRAISNTATLEWGALNQRQQIKSNTVVTPLNASDSTTISSYIASATSNLGSALAASCGSAALGASIDTSDLTPSNSFSANDVIVLMVDRQHANINQERVDTIQMVVRSGGDREILTFVETAMNSGRFTAAILADVTGAGISYDCHLRALVDGATQIDITDVNSDVSLGSLNIFVRRTTGQAVAPLAITKTASRTDAESGDLVRYQVTIRNPDAIMSGQVTVNDLMPEQMRFKPGSAIVNGQKIPPIVEGRKLTFTLPSVNAGAEAVITYVLEVRPGARAGDALNRAEARATSGAASNIADALVRIRRDGVSERMVIIGRVIDGNCQQDPGKRPGVPNARVMLEDGSYVITDENGLYRFEGVQPGTHVVQLDEQTVPLDRKAVSCSPDVRAAGSSISRFVDGSGGTLKRVDFNVVAAPAREARKVKPVTRPVVISDQEAAGGNRDWFANITPGTGWLFPAVDHNPRAPAVRVVLKHAPGQKVILYADGKLVDAVTFEGTRKNEAGTVAVSMWRGIPIDQGETTLEARVVDAKGKPVETLKRTVAFSNSAVKAEIVPSMSRLVADGVTPPIIALKLTDGRGRPVHQGMAGEFYLPEPYRAYSEPDAKLSRQLAGIERARPVWHTIGDDGIALVELEPTTATGAIALQFNFRDGDRSREQRVEAWMSPGDQPWTIVGLAEGSIGFNKLNRHMESIPGDDKLSADERIAFYAKGRIKGQWLMTLAYDSDKKSNEGRLAGLIEPNAYYTVYADRSQQQSAAPSIRKLYLKIERPKFYALFGDFQTNIDEPKLTRYVRALNGLKAEYRNDRVSASVFAADTPTSHRHEELQGNGLSGPYMLSSRHILANSEQITVEIRDRFNWDRIIDRRTLVRYQDYDINYFDGTVRFYEPMLSRDFDGNPRFLVFDYEVDGVAARKMVAGGRVVVKSKNEKLQVGATVVHDADALQTGNMAGVDVKFRPTQNTEVRGEIATSKRSGATGDRSGTAWRVEAERHTATTDVLAYASETPTGFGVGQTSPIDSGMRKYGLEGRVRVGKQIEGTLTAWHEERLDSDASRNAGRAQVTYRDGARDLRAGVILARDHLANGEEANSTLLQLGASQRMFNNKLEIGVQSDIPIGGSDSIDFPARHALTGRYTLSKDVALVGTYEIAKSGELKSRTARMGVELTPWAGSKIGLGANLQDIAGFGPRTYANFGASQSVPITKKLTVDATIDGNKTIGGVDPARLINPDFPVATSGFLGSGALTEDFLAVTAGATYRSKDWTIAGRAEWRDGTREDRRGFTLGALRQIGEGRAFGGAFNWYDAKLANGAETRTVNAQLSWAHRPLASEFSFLDKLEIRDDRVTGAIAGTPDILSNPLNVTGDAHSLRAVNSLAVNWVPGGDRGSVFQNTEVSLFWGARYTADRFDQDDIKGFSNVLGADIRYDLGRNIEIGLAGTARAGLKFDTIQFSGGPQIGFSPVTNTWLQLGYNIAGFRDRDFEQDRYTRQGIYAALRVKLDQTSLSWLGLDKR